MAVVGVDTNGPMTQVGWRLHSSERDKAVAWWQHHKSPYYCHYY